MRIAKSIFVGSLAALVLVAAPALAKNSDGQKTEDKQLRPPASLPAGPRWIMDAIALRRDGRKGTAEEHHARHRPTNAVSPAGACPPATSPSPKRRAPHTALSRCASLPSHASPAFKMNSAGLTRTSKGH